MNRFAVRKNDDTDKGQNATKKVLPRPVIQLLIAWPDGQTEPSCRVVSTIESVAVDKVIASIEQTLCQPIPKEPDNAKRNERTAKSLA